jgi:hypothetical protein
MRSKPRIVTSVKTDEGCEPYIRNGPVTPTPGGASNEVDPTRRERGEVYERDIRDSPYAYLRDVAAGRDLPLRLRRRLTGEAQRDFPFLEELANSGATDYVAELIPVGMVTEAFPDSGIGFSFATDHPEGFGENDLRLIQAVLPAVAALRPHGAQVLKFLGDGMLASFTFVDATRDEICGRALDAAAEATHDLDRLNADRAKMGKPIATVDLALHLGEVLYGNVGAVDRLDFTVIGPAVNEVARERTRDSDAERLLHFLATAYSEELGPLRPISRNGRPIRSPRRRAIGLSWAPRCREPWPFSG